MRNKKAVARKKSCKISFKKLSLTRQRKAIVKDVLLRLKIKQLNPEEGTFASNFYMGDNRVPFGALKDMSIKEFINKPTNSCDVCAKGALFMSHVGFVNKANFSIMEDGTRLFYNPARTENHTLKNLLTVFSKEQLDLIEAAFEVSDHHATVELPDKELAKAIKFGKRYKIVSNRLKAICNNMLENKGIFRP